MSEMKVFLGDVSAVDPYVALTRISQRLMGLVNDRIETCSEFPLSLVYISPTVDQLFFQMWGLLDDMGLSEPHLVNRSAFSLRT